ncbi:MAG: exodeoxyribonuclease VII large subunit [Spirochaetia bacterium]|nr:exodeoxyribonuclease VII large subunit [Spirochaetia bacterium]
MPATTPDTNEKPLTIYEVTRIIESKLTGQPGLLNIYVKGEITDFKVQPGSGHAYFTLADKDSGSSPKKALLKCTFFRYSSQQQNISFTPRAGMEVLVFGSISVYYQGGQYNFNAREIIEVGLGRLLIKIQELRIKLINEGIINPETRKKLPEIPRRIGIVTGLGTAALKDILKQVHDRYPHVEIIISPALVQGEDAPKSIVSALEEIAKPQWMCDVIIVGRGGGSPEDLMGFNDEMVCRAIHACPVPVISGVGHQIDHPVSDDVADVAAATPTDAAKLALPVIKEKKESLDMLFRHINNLMSNRFHLYKEKLLRIQEKPFYRNPEILIIDYYRLLDEKENRIKNALSGILERFKNKISRMSDLENIIEKRLMQGRNQFEQLSEKLEAFSPLATLKRGYSVLYQGDKIMNSIKNIHENDKITVRTFDGRLHAIVQSREIISS